MTNAATWFQASVQERAPALPPRAAGGAEAREVEALRARDPEAMHRLVRRQSDRLFRAISRLVNDPDEARNLVQETFLHAWLGLPAFQGRSSLSTWLYGIAMNVARSHLRKARRYRVLSEEALDRLQPRFDGHGAHEAAYAAWDPEAATVRRDRVQIVREAIDRLPPEHRMIVVLRDLEELSTAEVAEVLKISQGNVRIRLHRARNALRSLLAPHFAEAQPAVP